MNLDAFPPGIKGLSSQQVEEARKLYGTNELNHKRHYFYEILLDVVKEPMVLLLLLAGLLYFITEQYDDGIFMIAAIVAVIGISVYQDNRSRKAIAALQQLTSPACRVIRDGVVREILRKDLVVGDVMLVEEGSAIPADGVILSSNDFSVNEATLTGESLPVSKDKDAKDRVVYQGTSVVSGLAICEVTAIGSNTEIGRIGKNLELLRQEETPLQKQIHHFVRLMAFAGIAIFLVVWALHYFNTRDFVSSLLKALTLAMSILPEEIPVAFTTFMALGAWRLMKKGVVVKQIRTVETLGSATVICVDKTGTITENRMALAWVYDLKSDRIIPVDESSEALQRLVTAGMWASEPIPFDPLEKALHDRYETLVQQDQRPLWRMVHEYPLGGRPPMMTHVFQNAEGERIIAAKGAAEALLRISDLTEEEKKRIGTALNDLSSKGYRVLAVGEAPGNVNPLPEDQHEFKFSILGLLAFSDPPKKNITAVLRAFYEAGIKVKIITGDNAATTSTIARQVEFAGAEKTMESTTLQEIDERELASRIMDVNIFTRMHPEAKLRLLQALKSKGEIVAMTGDGVNDALALKAAHIGIAMGKRGTEIAKEASSLILTDDDLARMVDAIAIGRRIYSNLKKAIQYIISIHIPIILTVLLPLALGWIFPSIFTPVHVIFLELIMGPTCSIIYENEPMERNLMNEPPRPFTKNLFSLHELSLSIIQGLAITTAVLLIYQWAVGTGCNEAATRTMVFVTLITANIFLTLVNRSFYYSIIDTLRYRNFLVPVIILVTIGLTTALLVFAPLRNFFSFEMVSPQQIGISVTAGVVSVIWFEVVKLIRRSRSRTSAPVISRVRR
jgi:P-type Ca2+ transporter type 2C